MVPTMRPTTYRSQEEDDMYGYSEVEGKSINEIANVLHARYQNMTQVYHNVAIESGFREELFDDTQMYKDLWLYSIFELLSKVIVSETEQVQYALELLNTLGVNNLATAQMHVDYRKTNPAYARYMYHCFSTASVHDGFFWDYACHMGSTREENREAMMKKHAKEIFYVSKEYIKLMNQIEIYMKTRLPRRGFGNLTPTIMPERIAMISAAVGRSNFDESDLYDFLNPVYFQFDE